jgi:hypothetical protein
LLLSELIHHYYPKDRPNHFTFQILPFCQPGLLDDSRVSDERFWVSSHSLNMADGICQIGGWTIRRTDERRCAHKTVKPRYCTGASLFYRRACQKIQT